MKLGTLEDFLKWFIIGLMTIPFLPLVFLFVIVYIFGSMLPDAIRKSFDHIDSGL